jgi:hypothetical protein
MGALKICLLISEDPDDHQILFEAIQEISKNIALTILLEGDHLIQILTEETIKPDFIVVDTGMSRITGALVKQMVNLEKLKSIPVIIYTDDPSNVADHPVAMTMSKRLPYSEIRSKFKEIMT